MDLIKNPDGQLAIESYDELIAALKDVHPEDLVNIISRVMLDRDDADLEANDETDPSEINAKIIVPGYEGPAYTSPDREFYLRIAFKELVGNSAR